MVATKAKVLVGMGQPTEGDRTRRSVATGSFKVYSEKDKIKVDSSCKKPVTIKIESTTDYAIRPKGGLQHPGKNKDQFEVSGSKTIGRRALADVSNVRGNPSRKSMLDDSKPKVSIGTRARSASVNVSSRKSLGKALKISGEAAGDLHTSRKESVKDSKAYSVYERNKIDGPSCESSAVNVRRTKKSSLVQTRRSLPMLKRINQTIALKPKDIPNNSEKAKGTEACPVIAKFGKSAVAQAKSVRCQPWKNRVSNGFIIMGQANVQKNALSKKSSKPIVSFMKKASGNQKASKPKNASGVIKSIYSTASSSKTEEASTSLSENISNMFIQGKDASEPTCNPSTNTDIAFRKKVGRRRSYTSLLVAGAKLLDGCAAITKLENLPSIDNDFNQMEVAEYVEEIYHYYWLTEAQSSTLSNYLSIQTEITPLMRGILVNWLIEVHFKFDLMHETLFLSVTLFDRYLSQVIIKKNEMQLVGLTALLLASKYEDFWHPRVNDLISISAESYSREQMLQMEALVLKKLKFRLNMPTPYVFMLRFLKAAQSNSQLEHLSFYLIELTLVEYEALSFKPSLLCASAIYVARCTLRISPYWTPLLNRHARYEVSQLRKCAEMILKFHKSAESGQLKVTYEKYLRPDFNGAAAVKPLDKLPP